MRQLKPGARLKSAVCATEVMVVRAPAEALDLRCGGAPMLAPNEAGGAEARLDPAFAAGSLVGKRYVDGTDRLELLCTKGGQGSLSLGTEPLGVKQARALPSSD